ncbi:MAG: hypothetical protein ACXW2U_00460 [Telluria sp.]
MTNFKLALPVGALAAIALLAGCGGAANAPVKQQITRIDLLASNTRGMQSIAFSGGTAYLSLSNTATEGSAVLRTGLPLAAASQWSALALGPCGLGKSSDIAPPRAPTLKKLGDTMWLFQPWFEGQGGAPEEHALCTLNASGTGFMPQDQGLRTCYEQYCYTLWMDDLKLAGSRLYTNAGAGLNLFVSDNQAASWRVLLGQFDSMVCTHQSFHIVGARLLAGGECPLDDAFLRAYALSADGARLLSQEELPIDVPELENRNIQFIESVAGTQRVFAGVEGGLLRSDDGGRSFRFVIRHPIEGGATYPYIGSFLSPAGKPNVLVVGGFDKANARPYLAWSNDGGDNWTDLSAMLPGYTRAPGQDGVTSQVTSLAEDPQGRLLLTLNEDESAKGKLMLLTLGKP